MLNNVKSEKELITKTHNEELRKVIEERKRKELESRVAKKKEFEQEPSLEEWSDMFIVACGIARFDSILALHYFSDCFKILARQAISNVYVQQAVDKKMQINRNRTWGFSNGNYQHINE